MDGLLVLAVVYERLWNICWKMAGKTMWIDSSFFGKKIPRECLFFNSPSNRLYHHIPWSWRSFLRWQRFKPLWLLTLCVWPIIGWIAHIWSLSAKRSTQKKYHSTIFASGVWTCLNCLKSSKYLKIQVSAKLHSFTALVDPQIFPCWRWPRSGGMSRSLGLALPTGGLVDLQSLVTRFTRKLIGRSWTARKDGEESEETEETEAGQNGEIWWVWYVWFVRYFKFLRCGFSVVRCQAYDHRQFTRNGGELRANWGCCKQERRFGQANIVVW